MSIQQARLEGAKIALDWAIAECERQANSLQLPDAHGGSFTKKYGRNCLLGLAGTLRNVDLKEIAGETR